MLELLSLIGCAVFWAGLLSMAFGAFMTLAALLIGWLSNGDHT